MKLQPACPVGQGAGRAQPASSCLLLPPPASILKDPLAAGLHEAIFGEGRDCAISSVAWRILGAQHTS